VSDGNRRTDNTLHMCATFTVLIYTSQNCLTRPPAFISQDYAHILTVHSTQYTLNLPVQITGIQVSKYVSNMLSDCIAKQKTFYYLYCSSNSLREKSSAPYIRLYFISYTTYRRMYVYILRLIYNQQTHMYTQSCTPDKSSSLYVIML
jgi:hypothetical protein